VAEALDAAQGGSAYRDALAAARRALANPATLPSARVLATMRQDFAGSYTRFIRAQAEQTRSLMLEMPWSAEQQAAFSAMARVSVHRREAIEAADEVDFEAWRVAYLDPARLGA
jgi:glutamate--cysteine ligase